MPSPKVYSPKQNTVICVKTTCDYNICNVTNDGFIITISATYPGTSLRLHKPTRTPAHNDILCKTHWQQIESKPPVISPSGKTHYNSTNICMNTTGKKVNRFIIYRFISNRGLMFRTNSNRTATRAFRSQELREITPKKIRELFKAWALLNTMKSPPRFRFVGCYAANSDQSLDAARTLTVLDRIFFKYHVIFSKKYF